MPSVLSTTRVEDFIESTFLAPTATKVEIHGLCVEAVQRGFGFVCVRPEWADWAKSCLLDSTVELVVVVGFHDGSVETALKIKDVETALAAGADEIDMVVNTALLKVRDYAGVSADIRAVVEAAQGKPVKVILESHLIEDDSVLDHLAHVVCNAGARFLKTCTGFTGAGATVEAVRVLASVASCYTEKVGQVVQPKVRVKASGGVRTAQTAIAMIEAGASRLGTSSGRAIADGWAEALAAHLAGTPASSVPDGVASY